MFSDGTIIITALLCSVYCVVQLCTTMGVESESPQSGFWPGIGVSLNWSLPFEGDSNSRHVLSLDSHP